ncbi:MAG: sensor histidine kinase [Bacteroidales bacterium]|nr:sensor histidine kinase [Bacteroidales bacterium]
MNKRIANFLYHLPVWLVAITIIFLAAWEGRMQSNAAFLFADSLIIIAWFLGSFYIFFSWLVPKYLETKKFRQFGLYGALIIVVLMPAITMSLIKLLFHLFGPGNEVYGTFPSKEFIYPYLGSALGTAFCGGLGTFYRFGMDWYNNLQLKQELKNQNLQSELKTLKSKLNPHLLFNTLNNIDTLIETSPKKASSMLSKLSDLLRYVVYETEEENISIHKEIEYLEKYIELEKIRLVNPEAVQFVSHARIDLDIPPMLFFPFIENAFKHSNLNDPEQHLSVKLEVNENTLSFDCRNTIHKRNQAKNHSGMGLELTRKRLDLLFPGTYRLTTEQIQNEYHVQLIIRFDR